MAHLYQFTPKDSSYARRNWRGTPEEYQHALETSTTVYVGNLSFYTREEQIWELFSVVGEVRRIVMGLNKHELTPCGFCFVEYFTHEAAEACVNFISGTYLDERLIRADWDTGFVEGRQFGRGSSGGQVRDDFRETYDPERGDKSRGPKSRNDHQRRAPTHPPPSSSSHHPHDRSHSPRQRASRDFGDMRLNSPSRAHSPFHERDHHRDHRIDRMDVDYAHSRSEERSHPHHSRGDRYDYDRGYGSRHSDQRHKRGREDDRGRYSEPMVDEFGRDIPPSKKSKFAE